MQETEERGLTPGWGRPPGGGQGNIHSSTLAWSIPMDRGARGATAHVVAKSWTQLSDLKHANRKRGEWVLVSEMNEKLWK